MQPTGQDPFGSYIDTAQKYKRLVVLLQQCGHRLLMCNLEFEHLKAFNFCDGSEGK
jgi:hypothetical protein